MSHTEKVFLKKLYDDQPEEVDNISDDGMIAMMDVFNEMAENVALMTVQGTRRLLRFLRKKRRHLPPVYRLGYKEKPKNRKSDKRVTCPHCLSTFNVAEALPPDSSVGTCLPGRRRSPPG